VGMGGAGVGGAAAAGAAAAAGGGGGGGGVVTAAQQRRQNALNAAGGGSPTWAKFAWPLYEQGAERPFKVKAALAKRTQADCERAEAMLAQIKATIPSGAQADGSGRECPACGSTMLGRLFEPLCAACEQREADAALHVALVHWPFHRLDAALRLGGWCASRADSEALDAFAVQEAARICADVAGYRPARLAVISHLYALKFPSKMREFCRLVAPAWAAFRSSVGAEGERVFVEELLLAHMAAARFPVSTGEMTALSVRCSGGQSAAVFQRLKSRSPAQLREDAPAVHLQFKILGAICMSVHMGGAEATDAVSQLAKLLPGAARAHAPTGGFGGVAADLAEGEDGCARVADGMMDTLRQGSQDQALDPRADAWAPCFIGVEAAAPTGAGAGALAYTAGHTQRQVEQLAAPGIREHQVG
jgi:hypothetical protein